MSYTVPSNLPAAPMKVTVNDVTYNLMPGETVNIPDKVRDELLRALGVGPKTVAASIPFQDAGLAARVTALEGSAIELPAIGDSDTGKVLTVCSSGPEWATASGGGGGVLVVTDTSGTLDKTWQEIHDADFAVVKAADGYIIPVMQVVSTPVYGIAGEFPGGVQQMYVAESADAYPTEYTGGD